MTCHNNCGDNVWWNNVRKQWVHTLTGKAVCAIPFTTTLTASPSGDVWPSAQDIPARKEQSHAQDPAAR